MPGGFDLDTALKNAGSHLDTGAIAHLSLYLDLLVQWNRKTNLVGPRDAQTIFDTLIVDSLRLGPFLESLDLPTTPLCLDLGAGAGLPGIPLRCLWTRGEYHLVEVREKRCVFMRLAVGRMGLERTHVFQGRAEDALARIATARDQERQADLVLSRAFMPWAELLPFVRPMLALQGRVVVLANEPLPFALPAGWKEESCTSYRVQSEDRSGERWFWALRRVE
ncbi:MAG: 16S rRNA (guanine(527)-N(7))-methyltransferase RsmG [Desulfovibrio sp.]